MFAVAVEKFDGPLDLLLSLIESEKMDICQISLSKITGNYIKHVEEMNGSVSDMADFLVVAAKLLYLKSKELLPAVENEDDEKELQDLEQNLIEYARYKKAAEELDVILAKNYRSYPRKAKAEFAIGFMPPSDTNKDRLWKLFQDALKRMEIKPEKEVVTPVKITLEEKRQEIAGHLKNGKTTFRQIMEKAGSRVEVIVTFLALLEMIKKKEIKVKQTNNFSDLTISIYKL